MSLSYHTYKHKIRIIRVIIKVLSEKSGYTSHSISEQSNIAMFMSEKIYIKPVLKKLHPSVKLRVIRLHNKYAEGEM